MAESGDRLAEFIEELVGICPQVMAPLLLYAECHALPRVCRAAGFNVRPYRSDGMHHVIVRWWDNGQFYDARGRLTQEQMDYYGEFRPFPFRDKDDGLNSNRLLIKPLLLPAHNIELSYPSEKTVKATYGHIPAWYGEVQAISNGLPSDAREMIRQWDEQEEREKQEGP